MPKNTARPDRAGLIPIPPKAELSKAWLFRGLAGCGAHGCVVRKPTGMATNGGCRCKEHRSTVNLIFSRLAALPDGSTEELNDEH